MRPRLISRGNNRVAKKYHRFPQTSFNKAATDSIAGNKVQSNKTKVLPHKLLQHSIAINQFEFGVSQTNCRHSEMAISECPIYGGVAQGVEQRTLNPQNVGPNPTTPHAFRATYYRFSALTEQAENSSRFH